MTIKEQLDPERVYAYAVGFACASACAPKETAPEQVAAAVNAAHPTGIASQWKVARVPFRDGSPNPGPCNEDPDGRLHWLLEC